MRPKHKNAEHAGEIVDLIHMRNFARVATGVALLNYAWTTCGKQEDLLLNGLINLTKA